VLSLEQNVTFDKNGDTIKRLSAIRCVKNGVPGKPHLVREVHASGGISMSKGSSVSAVNLSTYWELVK
jgi:hypothetical protein